MASLELPADHTAAVRARRFVAEVMTGWGYQSLSPDTELLTSELVTNAILHARSQATVSIERIGARVRVSVCDGSASPPRLRNYGPDAVTGRGMVLVDRIARRWGVDLDGNGKCVWFEVEPTDSGAANVGA